MGVRRAQKVAKNEVGADVALKQADFWGQVQRAAGRQFSAVVNDDVGVVHQFFLQLAPIGPICPKQRVGVGCRAKRKSRV